MKPADRAAKAVFWAVLLLGAVDRWHLTAITIGYTSDDLTVLWLAARDYAHGIFHEPFFYGQNYGVMLEALLAAPFVRLGADPARAVPITMAVLALLPYWSFALSEYRRLNLPAAVFLAATPLLLPVEHGLQFTNLNGLAVLACWPWTAGMRPSFLRSALIGAVLSLSAFVNLNALVAVAAFGTYFLLQPSARRGPWFPAFLGALPVLLFAWWSMDFLAAMPGRTVHTIFDWRMVFHASLIPEALGRLDAHFSWLCPLWWPNGHVVLWLLGALVFALLRRGRTAAAWALVAALLTILLSFAFAKIHDGTMSILFPYSRMYLAVPLLLGWGLARIGPLGRWKMPFILAIGSATLLTATLRGLRARQVWQEALADPRSTPIYMEDVSDLRAQCRLLARYAREVSADAVVLIRNPDVKRAFFLNTGCPICEPDLPPTYMPDQDRRYWRVLEEARLRRQRILFVGGDTATWRQARQGPFRVQRLGTADLDIHLVTGAGLPVDSLARRLGFRAAR
jgi:hypothetical protein